MVLLFGETLRHLRTEKGLSQQQLADRLHVERASVTNWEAGRRIPSIDMLFQIAEALEVDAATLLAAAGERSEVPNVLLLDDEPIILDGSILVLRELMPKANVIGFTKSLEALTFFRENPVALVFLDIELARSSGLELCRQMLALRPHTNVVFLTAYPEYSIDAWNVGASGFLLKPLDADEVRRELSRLRYPVMGVL
ncbi:MAG: helix-turn-helix domain-containing protein [Oscillospiraceae bacterium]|nr:helix-turn-helix domain-containing protein [Oscillospiraceae bacterium]